MTSMQRAMQTRPDDWTAAMLEPLTCRQLEVLARLLGVPHSGTKAAKIARLLDLGELRGILAPYETPGQMTPFFTRRTLVQMCKRAGIYAGTPKYGLAAGLLSWRNEARRRGQEFYAELQAARRSRPIQHSMHF